MALNFRIMSVLMALIGLWLLYSGFTMDVTVPGTTEVPRIANNQLMQVQLINFVLGGLAILDATVCAVGAALLSARSVRGTDGGNA